MDWQRVTARFAPVLLCALAALGTAAAGEQGDRAAELGNKPERLEWLQDAGFGMFIHYSHDSQVGSVISHSMVGASEDYVNWFVRELPKTFNPNRWAPDEIAVLARLCGMKYVVLTAKHHSGFCLWDTKTTDFKITNTPYGKDLLKGYVEALRRHGLAVGIYYSPEDFAWLHRNGHVIRRRNLDPHPDEDPKYRQFIRSQVTELFRDYGQIDVLFIDGEGEEVTKEVAWTLQPNCLITRGAIETPEQFVPGRPPEGPWESNLTMGTQWQYKPTNDDYKSGARIIEILIETRAKGGSLLLNVGPKPNGELPKEQEERLREVALWHAVNGEAIHGTRPWIIHNEDCFWFTKKKDADTVYVFVMVGGMKRGGRVDFVLHSVRATDSTRVSVLGQNDKVVEYNPDADATSRWRQEKDGVKVSVVRAQRLYNNHKWHNPMVVKLENVRPAFDEPPYASTGSAKVLGDGKVVFEGKLESLGGADQVTVGFAWQEYLGFAEATYNPKWHTGEVKPVMTKPGRFELQVEGLKSGQAYQYRACVRHPKILMEGDYRRVTVK
jgi:alpha-L-fucosidase